MDKLLKRVRRKIKIRKNVHGKANSPRVTVFRSNRFLYIQAIDDSKGVTLAAANSLKSKLTGVKQAEGVANELAELLKAKKILNIVFDRNGYKYHGSVKRIAEVLREKKINF